MWRILFIWFVDHLNANTQRYLSIELTKHRSKQKRAFGHCNRIRFGNSKTLQTKIVKRNYGFCVTYLRLQSRIHSFIHSLLVTTIQFIIYVCIQCLMPMFVDVHSSARILASWSQPTTTTTTSKKEPCMYRIKFEMISIWPLQAYGWIVFIFTDRKNIRKTFGKYTHSRINK